MTKKPVSLTHFSSEELLSAAGQFNTLYNREIETPVEYIRRKRERDMKKLIAFVVENELDETKRRIFTKVFFDGEKIPVVAQETGLTDSGVYKHYESAFKIIKDSLKYVNFYQNISRRDRMKPLESMRNNAFSALKDLSFQAVVMRLSRLMAKENVTVENLCHSLGVDEIRFRGILKGKIQPRTDEIVLLAGFFGVSTDYILKGDLS